MSWSRPLACFPNTPRLSDFPPIPHLFGVPGALCRARTGSSPHHWPRGVGRVAPGHRADQQEGHVRTQDCRCSRFLKAGLPVCSMNFRAPQEAKPSWWLEDGQDAGPFLHLWGCLECRPILHSSKMRLPMSAWHNPNHEHTQVLWAYQRLTTVPTNPNLRFTRKEPDCVLQCFCLAPHTGFRQMVRDQLEGYSTT